MAIYIVQSNTGRLFRRTGTAFPPAPRWLAIDTADYTDSAVAILAEPKLQSLEIDDDADADLTIARDVLNPEIIPAAV